METSIFFKINPSLYLCNHTVVGKKVELPFWSSLWIVKRLYSPYPYAVVIAWCTAVSG